MSRRANIRIMMTTDTVGGVWTYSTTLASALAASGAEVLLVTMGPRAHADQRTMLRANDIRLVETNLALEWQDPEGSDIPNARRELSRLEDEADPDVVHLNTYREAAFDWRAPVVLVAHSCVNSWALACRDGDWLSGPKWRHYTRAIAIGLSKARAWVSPSRAFCDLIADLYRPGSPGTVIWNGVAQGLPPRDKDCIILAAGRMWDRAKNMLALADAAHGLDWPLYVAGPCEGRAHSEISWLGNLPHSALRARMQRAAIFASPALYEPFGLSVLEAASAGCALVLSDIPSFRELWNGAAVFVDPRNPSELHRMFADLIASDERRARLQLTAYERSRQYSVIRMVGAYRCLYESLLSTSSRPLATHTIEVDA
jgi:glycosyltransferase involved in cell wall biosynthesis